MSKKSTITITLHINHPDNSALDIKIDPPAITTSPEKRLAWLEDGPKSTKPIGPTKQLSPSVDFNIPFPRLSTGSMKQDMATEEIAKYDLVCAKMANRRIKTIGEAQKINPGLAFARILCPQEFQGYSVGPNNESQGMPFANIGPITGLGNRMYPGHWLYLAPTVTTSAIDERQTTLTVKDTRHLKQSFYACIYNPPVGSFENTEHCRITLINGNTIQLERGFKSEAAPHPAGSIIAMHAPGSDGTTPQNWMYNLSTKCPEDAAGQQLNEALAKWHAQHYDKDRDGRDQAIVRVDAILLDSDFHYLESGGNTRPIDCNNDGKPDLGIDPNTGENWWGAGLEYFCNRTRELLPDTTIKIGGDTKNFCLKGNNGTQLENFPDDELHPKGDPKYNRISRNINALKYHAYSGIHLPRVNDIHNKLATSIYPAAMTPTQGNRPFRLAFGLSAIFDSWISMQNYPAAAGAPADRWFDEYAVDIATGESVPAQNYERCRQHKGWLGMPKGDWWRIYDAESLKNDLIPTDAGIWTPRNVEIVSVSNSAITIGKHAPYQRKIWMAGANGPSVSLESGKQYAFGLVAKSPIDRQIQVRIGNQRQKFFIPAGGFKIVWQFKPNMSTNHQIKIDTGIDDYPLTIEDLHLAQGVVNVFRRDFDNGTIIVNATDEPQTVDISDSAFRRIKGTQDPINDGSMVGPQITIDPYDAAILLLDGKVLAE